MIRLLEKQPVLTIIVLVGAMLFPFLDVLEVTIMEARNFVSAREMLSEGNWILTTMNGESRYEKPPLPTWLSAISAAIFGVKSVWTMRFPAVLTVMLLGSMVYSLSRKLLLSKSHSLMNGLVIITSLYVILIVFEAPWDIYAHTFMLTSIYCMICFLKPNSSVESNSIEKSSSRFLNLVGVIIFFSASILSKGPVSIYVLFLPFLISYLITFRKETPSNKWIGVLVTTIVGLLIGFSWYFYVRHIDPTSFEEMARKETENWSNRNVRPFYYYWSFFTQSGLWTIPAFISLLYPYMKTRVSNLKAYRFILFWVLLSVVLLSFIPEKKSRYLMPVLIPLSFSIGFYLEYLVRKFKELADRKETFPVYFNFGLIAISFVGAALYVYLEVGLGLMYLLVGTIGAVLIFRHLFHKEILKVIYILPLILAFLGLLGFFTKLPSTNTGTFDLKSLQEQSETIPVYSLTRTSPEIIWSYGGILPRIYSPSDRLGDKKIIPEENIFIVLEPSERAMRVEEYFSDYKITYMGFLDLNRVSKENRDYKIRRTAGVYLVEK